jgi:hypothetical protein
MVEAAMAAVEARQGAGSGQVAREGILSASLLWRPEDGDEAAFTAFCAEHWLPAGPLREALFHRFEALAEEIGGAGVRIGRRAQWGLQIDEGPLLPVDGLMAEWSPFAHLADDFFEGKLAFVARLNFPRRELHAKLSGGPTWSRRAWAEARLGDWFADRVPAAARQRRDGALARAGAYTAAYNLHTAGLRDREGQVYAEDKRLLMHWNLRDEIKAQYGQPGGLRRQRALAAAMARVVEGSIPAAAIDAAGFAWEPGAGAGGSAAGAGGSAASAVAEGPRRYEHIKALFEAEREIDAASPEAPTVVARRFDVERELSKETVAALLESLFASPAFAATADRARELLDRPLEAFDIWFRGFGGGSRPGEAALDALTRARWPNAAAFEASIPAILRAIGFPGAEADWLAARIAVDPARGSGHALGAGDRGDKVHLRTRVGPAGMDYKGYNIALHELGHNVEQVYSLHGIDEYFLSGVPNTAFTEAIAFVFQARDLEVLRALGFDLGSAVGGKAPAGEAAAGELLSDYWATCEIAGVALVDMALWDWLYAHPGASAAELRDACLRLARETWNRLFAPVFGLRDQLLLASYAHMVEYPLYLPDYPLGHLIAFQVEEYLRGKDLASELGRICRLGRLTPGEWMRRAVGSELSAAPLVGKAEAALEVRPIA